MKIEKKTSRWVEEGLISSEQGQRIVDFEYTGGKSRWSQIILYSFVILGCCVVSIGLVSLIAANWEDIPETLKLGVAFIALAGLGGGIYWAQLRDREIVFDVLSTIFILWCLATTGLISQVFHTGGEPYEALAFWLAIVLPLSCLGKRSFPPSLWVVGLLATFFTWVLNEESWWAKVFYSDASNVASADLFALPIITALWTLLLASVCARLSKLHYFAVNFSFWGLVAVLVAVLAGDIYYTVDETVSQASLYPAYLFLPLALSAILSQPDAKRREKVLLSVLLFLGLMVYLLPLALPRAFDGRGENEVRMQLLAATYSITSGGLLAFYFAVRSNVRLFHAMTILIGIRFLVIYFQVFEDLAYTGLGLVISGLVIVIFAITWYKLRPRIEAWAQELVR